MSLLLARRFDDANLDLDMALRVDYAFAQYLNNFGVELTKLDVVAIN
jgi:hypothetical protein